MKLVAGKMFQWVMVLSTQPDSLSSFRKTCRIIEKHPIGCPVTSACVHMHMHVYIHIYTRKCKQFLTKLNIY